MTTTTFTILGSSSGMPQADRACTGYLLDVDNDLTLIDCGGGATSSFLRCGFDPLNVNRVFISHTHPDHCCELPQFIQMIYLSGRKEPLDIYLPDEFVKPFTDYLPAVYIIREKLPFELNLHGYSDGFVFEGSFRLQAIGNKHLHGYAEFIEKLQLPNRMQCHSFKIDLPGTTLFYSADIGSFDDIKPHLDGVDIAVLELTHVDLDQFFDFAQTSNVGRFVISHLGDAEATANLQQLSDKAGLDNLVLAHDGFQVAL
ncbi:MAG: MBL fold metallo-hydrolase [candidate division Zixibacteria bacterium]|nr:MBL fold metallo-hydrolase [candidate division Zixibacteria bacterium]MDH3937730.1 MBL fold metallo-hydrolase [candidate division Zixibacteria bacterium]MDH4033743.1 MBL fold metallo-hydrolase [candidate division Zixibacteria bacterium]